MDEQMEVSDSDPFNSKCLVQSSGQIGSEADILDKRKKGNSLVEERRELSSSVEEKPARGRGRGRRKPEMEVYVPRALRTAKQSIADVKAKLNDPSISLQEDLHLTNEKEAGNNPSTIGVTHAVGSIAEIQKVDESMQHESFVCSEDILNQPSHLITNSENSNMNNSATMEDGTETLTQFATSQLTHVPETLSSSYSSSNVSTSDSINRGNNTVEDRDVGGVNPLTFEFYDPAVIAFIPSAKGENDISTICSIPTPTVNKDGYTPSNSTVNDINAFETHDNHPDGQLLGFAENHLRDIGDNYCVPNNLPIQTDISAPDQAISLSEASHFSDLNPNLSEYSKDKTIQGKTETLEYHKDSLNSANIIDAKANQTNSNEDAEEDEDSWDALFDENGDCLDAAAMKEVNKTFYTTCYCTISNF